MSNDGHATAPDGSQVELGAVGQLGGLRERARAGLGGAPGAGRAQTWHKHHHPYLIVGVEGADNRMDFLDGSEPRHMQETPGRVVFRDAGKVHMLTNKGTTRYAAASSS